MLFPSQEDALAYIQRHLPEKDRGVVEAHVREYGRFMLDADTFRQKGASTLKKYAEEQAKGKVAPATVTALNGLFSQFTNTAEYSVFAPGQLADLLNHYRTAGKVIFEVAPSEKTAQRATGKLFESLFKSESAEPLVLGKNDAEAFLTFVRDTLVVSTSGKLGPTLGEEKTFPLEAAHVWGTLSAELNTHNAKSSHASAQYMGVFMTRSSGSGFLNGTELPPLLSGVLGKGLLRDRSWLVSVLPLSVQVESEAPFRVIDCLFHQEVRDMLASHGITAFEGLPVFEALRPEFVPFRVPAVRLKVTDDESVTLNILPANSMIKGMARLADLVNGSRRTQLGRNYLEAALKCQATLKEQGLEISEVQFVELFEATGQDRAKRRAALLKAINTQRERQGQPGLSTAQLYKLMSYPERVRGVRKVGVAASNAQNISAVYQEYAGTLGIPRFPCYQRPPQNRPALVRQFYALESLFQNALNALKDREQSSTALADKYKVGTRWLPQRVQNAIGAGHIAQRASMFAREVKRLAAPFQQLTESERLACNPATLKAIQAFALQGADCEEGLLNTLANAGLTLLKSANAEDHASFKKLVIEKLTEKKEVQQ